MSDAAHQNKTQIEILEPENHSQLDPNLSNVIEEKAAPTFAVMEDDDPYSLINILDAAPRLKHKILQLYKDRPELFGFDETKLKQIVGRAGMTPTLQRLRMALWHEYEGVRDNHRVFKLTNVMAGICGPTTFSDLTDDPHKLAFLICPPADYVVSLKEAHQAGLEKLREIFSAQITDDEGYLNPKAADMVIKAYALIDARLKGAIVQRIDQRTITANAQLSQAQTKAALGIPTDMDLLEKELDKTRKQLESFYRLPKAPPLEQIEAMAKEVKETKDE